MEIRHSEIRDIPEIMKTFDAARMTMRASGNMNQWTGGYPQESLVRDDIAAGRSYVVTENGEIAGTFVFFIGNDKTYDIIDGRWLNDEPYGVIHRIGSSGKYRGVLRFVLDFAEPQVRNIRIDTHADNKIMQHLLEKYGFSKCGTIYLEDGSPRTAYHKETQAQ